MEKYELKYYFSFIILLFIFLEISESKPTVSDKENGTYQFIKIFFDSTFTYKDFIKTGLDREGARINNKFAELVVNGFELRDLKSKKIRYELLVDDYQKFVKNKLIQSKSTTPKISDEKNFRLGTMGGSYTLEEVNKVFEEMRQKYPDYVAYPEIIGYTWEDRPITVYKIGKNTKGDNKEILFTALHHAREGSGLTTLVYFLWKLLEGTGNGDAESEYLLNNRIIYVVPVVNPDGVAYNEKIDATGGGMWRKNRRKINDTTYGVDLNRNYGPKEFWESGNNGGATNPQYETYRGDSPFSEPETQSMRDFCNKHKFVIAVNYHSYGEEIVFPWGAKNEETRDSVWYRSLLEEVTTGNKYSFGRGTQTVGYEISGDSDDWMYLDTPEKNKILAMTPEVGSIADGFWPSIERYNPIAEENLYYNYQILWSAGANLKPVKLIYDYDTVNKEGNLICTIQNIGTEDDTVTSKMNILSLDDSVKISTGDKYILPLNSNEKQVERFTISYPYGFRNGDFAKFVCIIEQDSVWRSDTFNLQLYRYSVINIFTDGSLGSEWKNDSWGVINDKTINRKVLTDSPFGNYDDIMNNYLIYNKPIFLSGEKATLEFNTKWNIEHKYDAGTIEVSENNGNTWEQLISSRMNMGIGLKGSRLDSGKYGFDGFYPDYIRQECDLSNFLNKNVIFRFGLLSDPAGKFDGIFLDNIKIRVYEDLTDVIDNYENRNIDISCFPSPIKIGELFYINFNGQFSRSNPKIIIYNSLGEIVYTAIPGKGASDRQNYEISSENLYPGFYFIRLECAEKNYFTKIIAIH